MHNVVCATQATPATGLYLWNS